MSYRRLGIISALAGAALLAGAVVAPAAVAATPSNICGTPTATISASSAGNDRYRVKAWGTQYCAPGAGGPWGATLTVSSYHNYDVFADPRVAYTSSSKDIGGSNGVNFATGPSTCDNFTTADYYAQSKFVSYGVLITKTSGNKNIASC